MGSSRRSSVGAPKDQTRVAIERMESEREARRQAMKDRKLEKAVEEQRNLAAGNPGDVDFIGLVKKWREVHSATAQSHSSSNEHPKICICVRKRPVSEKERKKRDHDSVTVLHPTVWVHNAKFRVDGITKYLDHSSFRFDHAFDETCSTDDVYTHCAMPLVDLVCAGKGCRATVFAYGQTGSGKTHTMGGVQTMVAEDLFLLLANGTNSSDRGACTAENTTVTVSFFELYGGRIQDLLNDRNRLKILEDGNGEVVVSGLEEFEANDSTEFLALINAGNKNRTTHATEANDTSSRSHAICQILLRDKSSSRLRGKLSLVDLAGSERGTDTKSHNRQRRTESSEINKSLLALKECIRALDSSRGSGPAHVPYRASKLTLVLKDCFTSKLAVTTMIATVSPGASSADHTINTLRYADRVKENRVGDMPVASKATDVKEAEKVIVSKSKSKLSPKRTPGRTRRSPSPAQTSRKNEQNYEDEVDVDIEPKADEDDLDILHASLREASGAVHNEDVEQLHRITAQLFEEEENLLNLHMSVIQENAELLTEEGRMLQGIQGDDIVDYDIDNYASRLGAILDRKENLITVLKSKLDTFRFNLKKEEELSKKVQSLPGF